MRHTHNEHCINDQFAIASPSIMKIYTNLINKLDDYINDNTCSEIVLAKHLRNNNINIERFNLNYKLVLSMCNTIGIAGNSASGKSTVANAIERIFKFDKKIILETDRNMECPINLELIIFNILYFLIEL